MGYLTRERAVSFTRYNSGKHFLDSGGANGRLWQKDAPVDSPVYLSGGQPVISLTRLLQDAFEEHSTISELFMLYCEVSDTYHMDHTVLDLMGFSEIESGNTFNEANDLDQDYQWSVWSLNQEAFFELEPYEDEDEDEEEIDNLSLIHI